MIRFVSARSSVPSLPGAFALIMAVKLSKRKEAHFDRLATALGHISIQWAWLERILAYHIMTLTPLEDDAVGRTITSAMDMRRKVQVLKALAFERRPTARWFNLMIGSLNYIDNNLRDRRNRFTHDEWYMPGNSLVKTTNEIKLRQPQAAQFELITRTEKPMKQSEVALLHREIRDASFAMFLLWAEAEYGKRPQWYAKFSRGYLRRVKPFLPRTYDGSKPKRQPRPTRA